MRTTGTESKGGKTTYESQRPKKKKKVEDVAVKGALKLAEKFANALIDSASSSKGAGGAELRDSGHTGARPGYEAVRTGGVKGFFRDTQADSGWSYANGHGGLKIGAQAPDMAQNGVIVADDDGIKRVSLAAATIGGGNFTSPVGVIQPADTRDIDAALEERLGYALGGSGGETFLDTLAENWRNRHANAQAMHQSIGPSLGIGVGTGLRPSYGMRGGLPGQYPQGVGAAQAGRMVNGVNLGYGSGLYPMGGMTQARIAPSPYPVIVP